MTAACKQAVHKASGLGDAEGKPMACEERNARVPCGARQGNGVLPLRMLPIVVVLGHIVVADIATVDDFAPHVVCTDGVQRLLRNQDMVHPKTCTYVGTFLFAES